MKKKLRLKKETIAILNGEGMRKVLGGTGNGCQFDAECGDGFVCVEGICSPEDVYITMTGGPCYSQGGTCITCNNTCLTCGTCLTCQTKCVC